MAILSRFLRKDAPSVEESVTDVCSCTGHCTRLRSVARANATLYYANVSNRLLLTGQAGPSAQATPVHLGCCTLPADAPQALGTGSELLQVMSPNRRDVRYGFLFGGSEADAPTRVCRIPPSPIEKLIPNQLVLSLTAHIWALQNCMSFIPKVK